VLSGAVLWIYDIKLAAWLDVFVGFWDKLGEPIPWAVASLRYLKISFHVVMAAVVSVYDSSGVDVLP